MASKVAAARKAGHFGVPCVVASGRRQRIVSRILGGEPLGTLFLPQAARLSSRKHWIAFTREPRGAIRVDEGAVAALRDRGKSLLPSGVVGVTGRFRAGDLVGIADPRGHEFARGLTRYSAEDVARIKGLRTSEIERALGHRAADEVIHRDDLVLL
jgi:glutamate 5-kinase